MNAVVLRTAKILMIEKLWFWHDLLKKGLQDLSIKADVLDAFSFAGAEKFLADNSDIDVIVVTDCLSGNEPDTIRFVKQLRKSFRGIIIGFSSNCNYADDLREAGCNCCTTKAKVAQNVSKFIVKK